MEFQHVDGERRASVKLFALSTCGWCKKTRKLLEELGIAYDYIYVDLLEGDERTEALDELKRWNPSLSFPTLVIDDKDVVVGFDSLSIKTALK
ncbi:glutaredoxin family protein [Methanothermobacter wolfeii]|uniref:Glutaredoxin family protein n=1 Tax=Methanothermobacter wolfeii TaxID=145261 RepID=A0A9E7RTD0_METWO|nr:MULTISPECIES: glutaredoxin family protein [Methanothermobacter]MDI6701877.1 glutaredoxin family protein [Methanothermobacter wolfeii]MDI6841322.1 glutaredoxin family protein [Methanothermobacter wolfeii]NLM03349.1 glutaredoxin family protein [Methanothermobacter wolfeii]QHN05715.1 glutaredoxin family protein [Methanothermobacter sp. THM-1]UXH31854.1 glutaredoxin family protein [Methanothermobacter wolfeii]